MFDDVRVSCTLYLNNNFRITFQSWADVLEGEFYVGDEEGSDGGWGENDAEGEKGGEDAKEDAVDEGEDEEGGQGEEVGGTWVHNSVPRLCSEKCLVTTIAH